jgi:hypothetical protein
MSATLQGSASSLTWGIASDESGLTIRSIRDKGQIQRKDVLSLSGEIAGFSLYNPTQNITVQGALKASGTFATATLAAAISMTNSVNFGGVTTGLLILMDYERTREVENFTDATFNLFRAPAVTA